MKLRRCVPLLALALAIVIGIAGCNRKVPPPAPPPPAPPPAAPAPPPPPPPPPPAPAPAPERPLTEEEIFGRKTVDQLNAERPLGEVLFGYDEFTLTDDDRATLQKNADYLRRWMSVRATIEGHADSRGTNEYNLALGERRANAAREYLVSLGIGADRLLAISKGEESPVCMEDNEACWQRNRRAAFVITAK
jgi:peptidoglycan-associated lipoprotein